MLGRLLNTLRYRLNRDFREWRKNNPVLREYAWAWLQRLLIAAGERPVRIPLMLCIFVLILSVGVFGYHTVSMWLSANPPPLRIGVDQHFITLWTIQASVTALIYPIVIGFVTLLLQRRHSAKASLHIYLHDSAAILTGLSALFLVFTMGIQFFFLHMVDEPVATGWMALDVLWFLLNILGVIWFLVRTFDYLRPERRAAITRAYAINYILPEEIRLNLEYHLFRGAISYGWLPGPDYGGEKGESSTAISLGPFGRHIGDIQVTERRKGAWVIGDVRFRLLSLALRSWQRRQEKLARSADAKPHSLFGMRHTRLLILPSVPGERFEPEVGLCRTEGASGLRWWERWLIQWSFALSPSTNNRSSLSLSISDLLNDLSTEVQIAMQTGQEVVFKEALHELVDLHTSLIQAGGFINDAGRRDNYANLANRNDIFEARMHLLWTREYLGLMDEIVARLPMNAVYFDYMVHVSGWLIRSLEKVRPLRILSNLLNLSLSLHYRLNRWWSKTAEEQGFLNHGPCEPCLLNAPAFAVYESAIKQFIGAWDSLKDHLLPPQRDDRLTWDECSDYTELFTEHLDMTLYMLFDCVSLGNSEGAEWLCDGLIKWWSAIVGSRFDHELYYIRDERLLTLELTRKPWEEAGNAIDLSFSPMAGINEERNAQQALWAACIHNYWTDLCCVSLYAMIQLGKDCACEKSLPARLIKSLAQGKALREGGEGIGVEWPVRTIEDLLIAIVRQYYFDGGYRRGYRVRLDEVVRRVSEQSKPAMVPGRVYTRVGLEDLDALRDGQLVLLCLFVKRDWSPSSRLMEMIQKWGTQDDSALRGFVDLLTKWKLRLSEKSFQAYQSLYSCVQSIPDCANDLQNAIVWTDAGINQLIAGIEGFRIEQLRNAQISNARLIQVARWSSQTGFSKDTADVPVSLFREVRRSAEEYLEHDLAIRVNKGEFVEPEMAQRASNETEWFDRTVSSWVARSVMVEILKTLNLVVVDVDGPALYWQQLKIAAMELRNGGGTPILFVAGRADPRWLLDWTRSTHHERVSRPEDLRFSRDNLFDSKGYVGSLNDIPVYIAPVGAGSSYLLPKEALDVLSFTEFEDGVFTRVSYEPIEEEDALINLRLSWRFHLDLKSFQCWRLRYIPDVET